MPTAAQHLALCRVDELDHGGCRGFELDVYPYAVFVVRQRDRIYAYRNSCPHTGAALNWQNDQFLNLDGSLIQCALHGAQFRIEDGVCVWGPCLRQRLDAIAVHIDGGMIVIELDAPG